MPVLSIRADKDAYLAEDEPDANHGAEPLLVVESKVLLVAANKRALCSFDLALLPSAAVRVVAATLRLVPLVRTAGRDLRCHQVTGTWSESAVTWDAQPGVGTDHGVRGSGTSPHEWDVTSTAQAAFPRGRAEFRVMDDAEGALLSKRQVYASRERPGEASALLVVYEARRAEDLLSLVRPRVRGTSQLLAGVRVAVAHSTSLPSKVRPRLGGLAGMRSHLLPRLRRVQALLSSVNVRRADADRDSRAVAAPAGPASDFQAISDEVGSLLWHTSRGGGARSIRRIVQVIDTRETQAFPRAVTSEHGRTSTQDQLRRGDALLFALRGDDFRPGDAVEWQGRTWAVVGRLGAEMVGDVEVYQEVGLRRLAVAGLARVVGTVEAAT